MKKTKNTKKTKKTDKKNKGSSRERKSTPIPRKKIVLASLILLFVILVSALIYSFLSKSTMGTLINFVKADESLSSFRSSSSVAIMSASTGESKAETFRASGDSLNQALDRLAKRVKESPDYPNYIYFRLDVAPFSPAAADNIISNFPELSEFSYFSSATTKSARLSDLPEDSDAEEMLMAVAFYIAGQMKPNGSFIYGYYDDTDEIIDDYSIPSHASATIALLNAYSLSGDPFLLEKIELALTYLKTYIDPYEPDGSSLAYVRDYEKTTYDLSSTALTALALADFANITGSDAYNEDLKKLISGINSLRVSDYDEDEEESSCGGSFTYYQELDPDFSITAESTNYSRWSDAKATYALIKAGLALDEILLHDKSLENLDFFIENDYASEDYTHWTVYAVASYLSLYPASDSRYYDLLISLTADLASELRSASYLAPTGFESLAFVRRALDLASEQGVTIEFPDSFESDLNSALTHQLSLSASAYQPLYKAIFSSRPTANANSFIVTVDDRPRSRLDDNNLISSALYSYLLALD